ncbi:hypothetical protein TNCV_4715371 [Trichonephila clavipes]|nr:hypothetical protein TNCV_4715371 [Trichonephila clavipes]
MGGREFVGQTICRNVVIYVQHLNALYPDFETRFKNVLTICVSQALGPQSPASLDTGCTVCHLNVDTSRRSGLESPPPDRTKWFWIHCNVFYLFTSDAMENARPLPLKVFQDTLVIYYKQFPDNAHSIAFSQRPNSPRLIDDETYNDSGIINSLISYDDGQEEPNSLRAD